MVISKKDIHGAIKTGKLQEVSQNMLFYDADNKFRLKLF